MGSFDDIGSAACQIGRLWCSSKSVSMAHVTEIHFHVVTPIGLPQTDKQRRLCAREKTRQPQRQKSYIPDCARGVCVLRGASNFIHRDEGGFGNMQTYVPTWLKTAYTLRQENAWALKSLEFMHNALSNL